MSDEELKSKLDELIVLLPKLPSPEPPAEVAEQGGVQVNDLQKGLLGLALLKPEVLIRKIRARFDPERSS